MDLRQTRCPLLLVADYRFFSEMGGGSSKTTVNYLISLIDRVHKIYEETVWKDSSGGQGFSGIYVESTYCIRNLGARRICIFRRHGLHH